MLRPLTHCLPALALLACYGEPSPLPVDDAGRLDAQLRPALQIVVRPRLPDQVAPDTPLRYLADAAELGLHREGEVPPGATWPRVATLDDLIPGTWQIAVFQDRDRDGAFDDCPFPPRVGDPERALTLDGLSGRTVLTGGRQAEVVIEQRVCGPGDRETGIAGTVVPSEPVPGPIVVFLQPVVADGESAPPSMRITLQDEDLDQPLPFSLGEILPGRWRLTLFADADGDATPSPCDGAPGGEDRFLTPAVEVEVVAGRRLELPEPLTLAPLDCPERLTGLTGQVALAPGLAPDPRLGGPLGPLAGPVRVAFFPSAGGDPVAATTLLPAVDARPLPHPFTLTHLPVGSWRLVAWVDRDDDGAFTPCGGLAGIDALWVQQEDVRVVDGEILELAPLELVQHPCDARAETGLTGRVQVELEDGVVGSGRPLRLELRPHDGGPVLRIPLLANHRDGARRFIASGLPAGRHDLIFHVDTDRDGVFVDCRQAPYADRAALAMNNVEIPEGQIVSLGTPTLSLLGCAIPRAELRPRVLVGAGVDPAAEGAVRLEVVEAGGYREERVLVLRHGPGREEPLIEPIRLAPGEFRLTAWLDTVADERLGTCGGPDADAAVARVTLRLDAANPQAEPLLVLNPACP